MQGQWFPLVVPTKAGTNSATRQLDNGSTVLAVHNSCRQEYTPEGVIAWQSECGHVHNQGVCRFSMPSRDKLARRNL